ncbi:hypothetical protein MA16_Dca007137 [Dendrobium catenatum]|uniref:Uncharacterized protein n=1 Tax=Dendrobium catenatum TaxID=906689 RepID=A0A2I0W3Y9_9ASPA|nr:hypothetical protein MA16_Dca007137 [Dendrobium catenatum]
MVVRPRNDVRRWSGGAEGLRWWFQQSWARWIRLVEPLDSTISTSCLEIVWFHMRSSSVSYQIGIGAIPRPLWAIFSGISAGDPCPVEEILADFWIKIQKF